jgi:hypothetical protein
MRLLIGKIKPKFKARLSIDEESILHPAHYFYCYGGGGESGGGGGYQQAPSSTTIQKSDPWEAQQPYLKEGFQQTQDNILNKPIEFFEGSAVVPFSDETSQALQMTKDRALAGSPINRAATDQLSATMRGDYLAGGPGFDAAVDAATRRILPGVDSQFAMGGRYGSGLAKEAQTRAISDVMAERYDQERTNQMRAMMFAPQIAELEYGDIGKLAAVGGQKEALQAEKLSEELTRHDFEQTEPMQRIANFMNLIQGTYGGTNTTTGPGASTWVPDQGGSAGSGFLGGAMGGVKLASMLGMGGAGMAGGGLLGGLMGGFF